MYARLTNHAAVDPGLIMPRCACAWEVYGSVFVCVSATAAQGSTKCK